MLTIINCCQSRVRFKFKSEPNTPFDVFLSWWWFRKTIVIVRSFHSKTTLSSWKSFCAIFVSNRNRWTTPTKWPISRYTYVKTHYRNSFPALMIIIRSWQHPRNPQPVQAQLQWHLQHLVNFHVPNRPVTTRIANAFIRKNSAKPEFQVRQWICVVSVPNAVLSIFLLSALIMILLFSWCYIRDTQFIFITLSAVTCEHRCKIPFHLSVKNKMCYSISIDLYSCSIRSSIWNSLESAWLLYVYKNWFVYESRGVIYFAME